MIELRDLRFDSSISGIPRNESRSTISLSEDKEMLVVNDNSVFWYKGDLLSRKLVHETPVVSAFFATFGIKQGDTDQERTLFVMLRDVAHIYCRDGRSYVISFPFEISSAFPYENGVVIERIGATYSPFLTMSEPMKELGAIVSSSTSSISMDEKLIHFPAEPNSSITVTYNEKDSTLVLYHTRFLNRAGHSLPTTASSSSVRRKPSQSSRRATVSTTIGGDNDTSESEIRMEKKRSVSHQEAMSIDRMASYDFNGNLKTAEVVLSSGSFEQASLRKDAIVTRLEGIRLSRQDKASNIKAASMSYEGKEAVILKNSMTGLFEVLLFESSDSSVSLPKFTKSITLSEQYMDFAVSSVRGFCALISKANEIVLFNPFLNLSSPVFKPSSTIVKIHDIKGSQMVAQDHQNKLLNYNLTLKPKLDIVQKCLSSFKYIMNSYSYNYLWLTWINAYAIVKTDWEAFVLTILSTVLPFAVKSSSIDSTNLISSLLSKLDLLQMRALKDEFSLSEMAPNIVLALHLIREDLKLNVLNVNAVNDIGLLLAQLCYWMCWSDKWWSYYGISQQELNKSIKFSQPPILDLPPDLMQSLASIFETKIVPYCSFSQLAQDSERVDEIVTPRTFHVLKFFEAIVSPDFTPIDVVNMMSEYQITQQDLDTYPVGIAVPLHEAITFCQQNVAKINDEDSHKIDLLDRKDLHILKGKGHHRPITGGMKTHTQQKDVHQIITSIQEPPDPLAPIEQERFDVTKHIFSEDRRFYEISKLLQTFQVQTVMAEELVGLPELESLSRQKELAILASLRTLSIPLGRSILFYASKIPLVTERFPIPKLNFNTLIQPENMTVSLEKDNISETLMQWGFFHNGAATGLTISREAKGISGSWIVFNKPQNLNSQHGGFLLGLGLNGHLKSLEEWNIYNYLGPKHMFTSVGLLLGMSISLRGTMDVKLTKVLSVHVGALLPQGASDLIVATPVQTAGLVGIGLLYLESQHRRMSEILLSQVTGKVFVEGRYVADESYRLAAGIALGYVNLGKANDLKGLNDTHIVDRLMSTAVSIKDVQTEEAFDKSIAGAVIALAFICLKTNNNDIAKKLSIPETDQLLDYIRPDLLVLRVLAKNLILWDSIEFERSWVESQVPQSILEKSLNGQSFQNLNYYHIVSGACLVLAIKYASTAHIPARNTILSYYDHVTELIDDIEDEGNYGVKLTKQALLQTQLILAIALSLVMAATGDLETFRRLRILHGKFKNTTNENAFGKFMATNMALGFLFLGGGQYAINTSSNFCIAALVTSIYPLFPKQVDNETDVHLQALRHFWALAVEPRCLVTRDVDTSEIVRTSINVVYKDGMTEEIKTPCLLPSCDTINNISLISKEYFDIVVDDIDQLCSSGVLYISKRRRVEVLKHSVKLLLREINAKFDQENESEKKSYLDFDLFQSFKKEDVRALFEDESHAIFKSNIIDRQIELNHMVQVPANMDDLWNLKLIFSYYDRLLAQDDVYYLSLEFVDHLKNVLWRLMKS